MLPMNVPVIRHVVNSIAETGVVVLFQMQFVVVTMSIVVQKDIPVMSVEVDATRANLTLTGLKRLLQQKQKKCSVILPMNVLMVKPVVN